MEKSNIMIRLEKKEEYQKVEILIFTVRVDSDRQASMVSVIMDYRSVCRIGRLSCR